MAPEAENTTRPHQESISRPLTPQRVSEHAKPTVVCVFCGSSEGSSPAHLEAARSLAQALHKNNINLVYGGGTKGMMGEVARTLVRLSGSEAVHGVIPNALVQFEQQGVAATSEGDERDRAVDIVDEKLYGKTTVVPNMHVRKQMMAKEVIEGGVGSGFIALSGGYGTLEELAEMTTWNQLGIHNRGVVVFNVEGYYDGIIEFVKKAVSTGFVSPGNASIMVEAQTGEDCVNALRNYKVAEGRLKLDWTTN